MLIRSDNAGVVGALKAGFLCNSQQNTVLQWIVRKLLDEQFWVSTVWVASADNRADGPSRGKGMAGGQRLHPVPSIPAHLADLVLVA